MRATIDALRAQQDRLREKLDWYRGELAAQTAAMSSTRTAPSLRSVT